MLRRLYVDNYKSLVNFDLEFKPLALLMGPNGSGKSTVFEVIASLRDFVRGDYNPHLFWRPSLTRWQSKNIQTFELTTDDLEEAGSLYQYKVEIEHNLDDATVHVFSEKLTHDGKALYESHLTEWGLKGKLYRDDYTAGPEALVDRNRSALPSLQPRPDNTKLIRFREQMARVVVVRIDPFGMGLNGVSDRESPTISPDSTNFVSWLRHMHQRHFDFSAELMSLLRESMPGLSNLGLEPYGEDRKVLWVWFEPSGSEGREARPYLLADLSEGQRVLILLYSLIAAMKVSGAEWTLCVDEPDNFVALREIQPWLNLVLDSVETSPCQALLISHHPEMINLLAATHGLWIDRANGGPARVSPVAEDASGLPPAELVARGWLNA